MVTQLLILFGTDKPDKMLSIMALREDHDTNKLANIFEINNTTTLPLRLHNGPYDFRATPNAGDPSDTTTRLALLKKYLHAQCDLWRKAQHTFIDAYFEFIVHSLDEQRAVLSRQLNAYEGLYNYQDWSFSALRPLPRAHIQTKSGVFVAMDFAFWTGTEVITINIVDFQTPTKTRRELLEKLVVDGIRIISLDSKTLMKDGSTYLKESLPENFHQFWKTEVLPQSPYKPKL